MACYLSESLGNNLCQFYSLICIELRECLIDLSKYVLKKSMGHTVSPLATKWSQLDTTMLSEISKSRKDKYHIISDIRQPSCTIQNI